MLIQLFYVLGRYEKQRQLTDQQIEVKDYRRSSLTRLIAIRQAAAFSRAFQGKVLTRLTTAMDNL